MKIRDVGFFSTACFSVGRIVDHVMGFPYAGLWVESGRFASAIVSIYAVARIFDVLKARKKKLWQR